MNECLATASCRLVGVWEAVWQSPPPHLRLVTCYLQFIKCDAIMTALAFLLPPVINASCARTTRPLPHHRESVFQKHPGVFQSFRLPALCLNGRSTTPITRCSIPTNHNDEINTQHDQEYKKTIQLQGIMDYGRATLN